jgi:hypothetical protein
MLHERETAPLQVLGEGSLGQDGISLREIVLTVSEIRRRREHGRNKRGGGATLLHHMEDPIEISRIVRKTWKTKS